MVSDKVLRLMGVPFLGLTILIASGLAIGQPTYSPEALLLLLFSFFTAYLIWQGVVALVTALRNSRYSRYLLVRLLILCNSTALYALLLAGGFVLIWQGLYVHHLVFLSVWKACFAAAGATAFVALVYEIIFLTRERQVDRQVVDHLDKELMQAEINVLRNELDPHFVYNSLMPLYYLVKNDVQKAEAFACNLIQVYQYFLENRQNDFITLEEELKFVRHYFFLLQIRYKDGVKLAVNIHGDTRHLMVLPLSLQLVIENVIKHNELDGDTPLKISICIEKNCLVVTNELRSKMQSAPSSGIGLRNLRARYRILADSDIVVARGKGSFVVRIPLIKNSKAHDVNHYHRG
jgi:sensor histidine kinase YesM